MNSFGFNATKICRKILQMEVTTYFMTKYAREKATEAPKGLT